MNCSAEASSHPTLGDDTASGNQGCNGECDSRVAQAAEEAINGRDSRSDPAAAFGAAMDAANSPGGSLGSGDAAASEQAEVPVHGSEAAAYRAAFKSAREAGLDNVAAKDAAEVAVAEASKTRKGGSPSEGIAAAEGKTSKAGKDRTSKGTAEAKDREDKKSLKDKARNDAATDDASEEETTGDTDEEVAASGEDGGTSGEDVQTAPAGGRVPLLLGGVAFLTLGGYAGLRFVQSRSLIRGRRLLRD